MERKPSSSPAPLSKGYTSVSDLEAQMGESLRRVRLDRNMEQATLAQQAGVSLRSLQRLELGKGSTTHTLLSVLRSLGREDWLNTIAPVATINPLTMPRAATPRLRARKRRPHDTSK
ncbi:MAG: helix-turn-helix transcriptional regulator [Proteobacteria bacterium]|nr:helix-turn-helix transcriptional regulator [Pseudomonadota bacterium]